MRVLFTEINLPAKIDRLELARRVLEEAREASGLKYQRTFEGMVTHW